MQPRPLSPTLLALNIGLAAALAYVLFVPRGPRREERPERTTILTNTVREIAVRKVGTGTNNLLAALGNRPLSWGALESTNYAIYIRNLQDFGCPDETIQDIILTDIARVFARRRAAILAQAPPPNFWEPGPVGGGTPPLPAVIRQQLQQLEQEQESLVRGLLGVGFRAELAKYWGAEETTAAQLAFLPAAKQQPVAALQSKYAALESAIYGRARGLLLAEDSRQLQELARAKEAELAQVLSPAELAEYQLRDSPTARSLRSQMIGFQPTEQEFRAVFQLQKAFDDRFGAGPLPADPASQAARARAEAAGQAALDREVQQALGPARFGEYLRAQDEDYRGLLQVSQRFNLPPEVANGIYDMKNTAQRQKALIESDASLSDEQRGQMIAAIARATERSVAQAMGEEVFRSYQPAAGQWLADLLVVDERNLAVPEPPPPPTPALPLELRNFLLNPPVLGNPPPVPPR
ncbi:MAG: hypothetical protein RJA22_962 [Verrucomicrobiota bacterium]|jgi:hypothetical protein